jgi:hypothetical protein
MDGLDGIVESRVDWTGRRFVLSLRAGAHRTRIVDQALALLGDDARELESEDSRAVLEAHRRREGWLRAAETIRQSRVEASVLAQQFGGDAADELELDAAGARVIVEVFEREFAAAFERTHARLGLVDVSAELATAARRILEACSAFLDEDGFDRLADYLSMFQGAGMTPDSAATGEFWGLTTNK